MPTLHENLLVPAARRFYRAGVRAGAVPRVRPGDWRPLRPGRHRRHLRNPGPAVLPTGQTPAGAGNPINVITGNKYQREVDLPPLPGVLGLELVRHYNSGFSGPHHANGFIGRGWRLSYETDLFVRGDSLHVLQADGSRLIFHRDPDDPSS